MRNYLDLIKIKVYNIVYENARKFGGDFRRLVGGRIFMKTAKYLLACFAAVIIAAAAIPVFAENGTSAVFSGGSGSPDDPYLVENAEQLDAVRGFPEACFLMVSDIVFESGDFGEGGAFCNGGKGWIPIGDSEENAFDGVFDGGGHFIKGVQVNASSESGEVYAGIFGCCSGTVKNLSIVSGTLKAESTVPGQNIYSGGIAGFSSGEISGCRCSAEVMAVSRAPASETEWAIAAAGGVAGKNSGTIADCGHSGEVFAAWSPEAASVYMSYAYSGGIAGYSDGPVLDSENSGHCSAGTKGASAVGGIAGYSAGTVSGCENRAAVESGSFAGGIAGSSDGGIVLCVNEGKIAGVSVSGGIAGAGSGSICLSRNFAEVSGAEFSGGVAGRSSGKIERCFNTGKISGTAEFSSAGGIAGTGVYGSIENCFNIGAVLGGGGAGSESFAGGIAGSCGNGSVLSRCYNSGEISDFGLGGAIAGENGSTIEFCCYLDNGIPGTGSGNDTAAALSEDKMREASEFCGFDFESVWVFAADSAFQYPVLRSIEYTESLAVPELSLGVSEAGVVLSWSGVDGAEGYRVYRLDGDEWKLLTSSPVCSYVDTAAVSGAANAYRVAAFRGGYCGGAAEAEIRYAAVPALSAENTAGGVKLTWTASGGASFYRLYRSAEDESMTEIGDINATAYTDASVEDGKTYVYTVKAYAGGWSAFSKSFEIKWLSPPVLTVSNTLNGVGISWEGIAGAEKYTVYRKTETSKWKVIGETADTAFSDTSASSGGAYYYTARAVSGGWRSMYVPTELTVYVKAPSAHTGNTSSGIKVTWEKIDGAEKYRVYRKASDGSKSTVGTVTGTEFTDSSAAGGADYTYTVRAFCGGFWSAESKKLSVRRLTTPKVSAENAAAGAEVSWNSVKGAGSYNVYRRFPGGKWSLLDTVTALSYTDATVKNGESYIYTVRALSGSCRSDFAESGVLKFVTAPAMKTGNTSGGVKISWSKVEGAEKYRVYRKLDGGKWERLITTSSTSYTDASAESGKDYRYTVRAYAMAWSGPAAEVLWRYLETPSAVPQNAADGVSVSWNSVKGANRYCVYRKTPGGSWSILGYTTGTRYTDTSPKNGTVYLYTVRALYGSYRSYYKASSEIRYVTAPKAESENVQEGVKISWSKVDGAEKYRVYRKTPGGSWSKLQTTAALSYTDTSAVPGVTYCYTVRAYAREWSGPAAVVLQRRLTAPAVSVQNALNGVSVSWNSAAGAERYRVYRRVAGGKWTALGETEDLKYTDTSASTGTTYYYAVRALYGSYKSSLTSGEAIKFVGAPVVKVSNTDAEIKVTWSKVAGADKYRVYRKVAGGSWVRLKDTSAASYVDASAVSGTVYYYTVRAYDDAWSAAGAAVKCKAK